MGGSGGQKGMKSTIERLSTEEFPRIRLGVDRPPGSMEAAAYVLKDFSKDEAEMVHHIIDRASDAVLVFIAEGLEAAMNKYNSKDSD